MKISALAFLVAIFLNSASVDAGLCYEALTSPVTVQIKDPADNRFFAQGTVTRTRGRNLLELVFVLKSKEGEHSKSLSGREVLQTILKDFESQGVPIDVFEATWTDNMKMYDAPSDNLVVFAEAYQKAFKELGNTSLASVKAAEATWTAKQMSAAGFKHLESIEIVEESNRIGSDGYKGKITVRVLWSKSAKKKFSFIDSGTAGRSAMPRFHNFIEYLSRR